MIPPNSHNRIQIAAEVAARLQARKDGAGYRTRGYCHGSGDKPMSASLVFRDPARPGEQSLRVHCFKCNPQTPAERDAIRHALQKATGLQLCLCPDCRQVHRTGQPPPVATPTTTAQTRRKAASALSMETPVHAGRRQQPPTRTGARRPDWGAHQLPPDDAGGRSHTTACPQCQQPDCLIAWTLADHPFSYCGLASHCNCALPYDQLHKHIADQIAGQSKQWRQDAIYTTADGRTRTRIRRDPSKSVHWDGQKEISTKGRRPLCWNHPRRGQPPDSPRVLLVEGEKAAAAIVSAGIDGSHAVYSVGDAAGFHTSDLSALAGREITLWPDADSAGINGAAAAARSLAPLAGRLLLVPTDDLPDKGDAADLTPRTIQARIQNAQEITQ